MYVYVPRMVRLKKPELIERWEELAEYARKVPPRPGIVHFANVLNSEWFLSAQRDKLDPSMVFFTRYDREDLETIDEMHPEQGARPVHTEYKVNEKVPFCIRHIGSTHVKTTEGGNLELASKDRLGLRGAFRLVRTAVATDALIPSEQELDELLEYLRNSRTLN
ncbi:hypothetical protein ABT282_08095 [Streptomyces sp. NPDC000927]|uniref:hypothetical protein n=1 Tax=Streptomyces sp. NPDC000927 TaxID=3154371 RepID=UPI00332335E7